MKIKIEDAAYASRIASAKLLEGTSQGSAFDRPPEHWIRDELVRFGVQKAKDIKFSDLEDCIHPLFRPRTWPELTADSDRYQALRPCLLLATKLLRVAAPFFVSIIPKPKYYRYSRRIHVNENPSEEQLQSVLSRLTEMAPYIEWREDPRMWPKLSRQGLTVPSGGGIKPDEPIRDYEDAEYWEETTRRDVEEGLPYRRITFYIASQYADVLSGFNHTGPPPNEQYLQTVFMCAITLVHEIGHLAFAANLSNRPWLGEPYVKGEALAELGTSLIGFLFDGWIPESITLRQDGRDDLTMTEGCCWFKQRRTPRAYPRYNIVHSMPLQHIQRILSQKEWDKFDDSDMASFSTSVRKNLLRPRTPFRNGETARIARKRESYRYDNSPTLRAGPPNVWDFHDPDWADSNPESGNTSPTASVKKEATSSPTSFKPGPDQENWPVRCDTGATTPSINIWDIPSATSSSPPTSDPCNGPQVKISSPKSVPGVKQWLENVVLFTPGIQAPLTGPLESRSVGWSSGLSERCHTLSVSDVPTVPTTPCLQRKRKSVKARNASDKVARRRSKRIRGEPPEMPDGLPMTPGKRARLS